MKRREGTEPITNRLLYQLSYVGINDLRGSGCPFVTSRAAESAYHCRLLDSTTPPFKRFPDQDPPVHPLRKVDVVKAARLPRFSHRFKNRPKALHHERHEKNEARRRNSVMTNKRQLSASVDAEIYNRLPINKRSEGIGKAG